MDKIDKRAILYGPLQFSHTKRYRDKYRIKLASLHILCSLYYSEHYMEPPKRGGVKTRLVNMNKQINYYTLGKYLDTLQRAGLIRYTAGNNLQNYSIAITGEGEELITELYSVSSIGELLNKY